MIILVDSVFHCVVSTANTTYRSSTDLYIQRDSWSKIFAVLLLGPKIINNITNLRIKTIQL